MYPLCTIDELVSGSDSDIRVSAGKSAGKLCFTPFPRRASGYSAETAYSGGQDQGGLSTLDNNGHE